MSSYVFPGHPDFLRRAAAELGRPETAPPAGKIAALAALANLCSQATHAEPSRAGEILAKAAEFRDHLHTALLAADLMLAEVQAGCADRAAQAEPPRAPADAPRGARAGGAKTTRGIL